MSQMKGCQEKEFQAGEFLHKGWEARKMKAYLLTESSSVLGGIASVFKGTDSETGLSGFGDLSGLHLSVPHLLPQFPRKE